MECGVVSPRSITRRRCAISGYTRPPFPLDWIDPKFGWPKASRLIGGGCFNSPGAEGEGLWQGAPKQGMASSRSSAGEAGRARRQQGVRRLAEPGSRTKGITGHDNNPHYRSGECGTRLGHPEKAGISCCHQTASHSPRYGRREQRRHSCSNRCLHPHALPPPVPVRQRRMLRSCLALDRSNFPWWRIKTPKRQAVTLRRKKNAWQG